MSETFSDDEIETLRKGAIGAGLMVAVSDRGFFDTFKEAGTLGRHMAAARAKSESSVVSELAQGSGTGFGLATPPAEIESETVDALRSSLRTLEAKAPDQVQAYRSFVLELARSVAAAAPGGETAEADAVAKVEAALATASRSGDAA